MSEAEMDRTGISSEQGAAELLELRARILAQSPEIRSELEPLIDDALEHAKFRNRVLSVAKDALGRYRLDLEMIRFDLEATKREHGPPDEASQRGKSMRAWIERFTVGLLTRRSRALFVGQASACLQRGIGRLKPALRRAAVRNSSVNRLRVNAEPAWKGQPTRDDPANLFETRGGAVFGKVVAGVPVSVPVVG